MEEKVSTFEITGDGTLADFLKYLEAVGVTTSNKTFFGGLKNQMRAYEFATRGSIGGLWHVRKDVKAGK